MKNRKNSISSLSYILFRDVLDPSSLNRTKNNKEFYFTNRIYKQSLILLVHPKSVQFVDEIRHKYKIKPDKSKYPFIKNYERKKMPLDKAIIFLYEYINSYIIKNYPSVKNLTKELDAFFVQIKIDPTYWSVSLKSYIFFNWLPMPPDFQGPSFYKSKFASLLSRQLYPSITIKNNMSKNELIEYINNNWDSNKTIKKTISSLSLDVLPGIDVDKFAVGCYLIKELARGQTIENIVRRFDLFDQLLDETNMENIKNFTLFISQLSNPELSKIKSRTTKYLKSVLAY